MADENDEPRFDPSIIEALEAEADTSPEAVARREAEVAALIDRANDPDDPYDGHHGNDRSEDSLEYAREHNPELAERIAHKIATGATE